VTHCESDGEDDETGASNMRMITRQQQVAEFPWGYRRHVRGVVSSSVSRFVIVKIMRNKYQDYSYNYTHNLYTRNIKYTIKRHRHSNKKHTHTVLCLGSSDNQHDTSSLAKSSSVTKEFSCFDLSPE